LAYILESQGYQAEVLKHATELFRRRKYRPTGGTFAYMLNDPAPAVSWSVVDWRRRPKKAYQTLLDAMRPVLICAEYPKERYSVGERISLPLFIINDLSRELGQVGWEWEVLLGGSSVASGDGETRVSKDSVKRVGKAEATLPAPGLAVLRLRLSGEEGPAQNEYEFSVSTSAKKLTS
jgi:beta-mannosidase